MMRKRIQPTAYDNDSFGRIRRVWVFRENNDLFSPGRWQLQVVLDFQELSSRNSVLVNFGEGDGEKMNITRSFTLGFLSDQLYTHCYKGAI